MNPKSRAPIFLAAFLCGLILAAVSTFSWTRYGTPNPNIHYRHLIDQPQFWGVTVGLIICAWGGVSYFWICSPDGRIKEVIGKFPRSTRISLLCSAISLLGFPLASSLGPWDIFGTIVLLGYMIILQLIAVICAFLSFFEGRDAIIPSILATFASAAIIITGSVTFP